MGRPGENDKKHRNYKKEYEQRFDNPAEMKAQVKRVQARRTVEKKTGDLPKDVHVDHKTPLKNGGGNNGSNLRTIDGARNSGWRKGQKGYKVKKV